MRRWIILFASLASASQECVNLARCMTIYQCKDATCSAISSAPLACVALGECFDSSALFEQAIYDYPIEFRCGNMDAPEPKMLVHSNLECREDEHTHHRELSKDGVDAELGVLYRCSSCSGEACPKRTNATMENGCGV